jgi:hypothetical protein
MQQIHGKLNIDKVDETMYILLLASPDAKWTALTFYFQGETPRTACSGRRDCPSYYECTYWRTHRRD